VVVLNLAEQPGETGGFAPADHLGVLLEHAPDLTIHTVIADRAGLEADPERLADLEHLVAAHGATLRLADVAAADGSPRHDPARLAEVYAEVFATS